VGNSNNHVILTRRVKKLDINKLGHVFKYLSDTKVSKSAESIDVMWCWLMHQLQFFVESHRRYHALGQPCCTLLIWTEEFYQSRASSIKQSDGTSSLDQDAYQSTRQCGLEDCHLSR